MNSYTAGNAAVIPGLPPDTRNILTCETDQFPDAELEAHCCKFSTILSMLVLHLICDSQLPMSRGVYLVPIDYPSNHDCNPIVPPNHECPEPEERQVAWE
jgi:hypothetical protein